LSALAERAEDAMTSVPLPPSAQVLRRDGYTAFHLPNPNPTFGHVQRMRLETDRVDGAIEEVRGWFAALGRERFSWFVGRHARPTNLTERLIAAGAVPADDPELAVMVLDAEPSDGSVLEVRPVMTFADFEAQRDIRFEAFGFTDEQRQVALARSETAFAEYSEAADWTMHLALLDGVPVAAAGLAFTSDGLALLLGGATLEHARGCGAYRALVRARWEESRRRGAAALVVHAGRMSRPILERLGFRVVSHIRVFVDSATQSS
jgi:hypothetical protein